MQEKTPSATEEELLGQHLAQCKACEGAPDPILDAAITAIAISRQFSRAKKRALSTAVALIVAWGFQSGFPVTRKANENVIVLTGDASGVEVRGTAFYRRLEHLELPRIQ